MSDVTGGPQQARGLQRDYLATQRVEWEILTPDEAAMFHAWWKDDLGVGGAWFASTWPAPQGWVSIVRRFVGTPQWTHLPGGFWRISATLLVRGRGIPPQHAIYVDVSAVANCGPSSSGGLLVTGFAVTDVLHITQPTGRIYAGYSAWPSDDSTLPPTTPSNQKWGNAFVVTGGPGGPANIGDARSFAFGVDKGYPTGEAARAAFVGPVNVTGYTEYVFWISDGAPSDNRGGASLAITVS